MKKIVVLLLVLSLFALTACGGAAPQEAAEKETEKETEKAEDSTGKFAALEITESGYSINSGYLYAAFTLHNPNKDLAVEFPTVRITARDADGIPLGTEDQVLSVIYPEQDFSYAFLAFEVEEEPESVEFKALTPEDYNICKPGELEHAEYTPLKAVSAAYRSDKVIGEVENNNDYDIDSAIVAVFFRDSSGKLIGGNSTFISDVTAGDVTPYDIYARLSFVTDDFEVYANLW